ncbi:uncharacterized protein LOC124531834 isoform X1 [Vanessa cardui]|uniref:uncharacterized protein LOC124531834 isoform X1 n=1 Tax=Vanessa cardui TaxID=171605 RepID=UPI001F148787|nr:uncharacterized protein LOC124531834 isoform X1 [Vanessa cardui]
MWAIVLLLYFVTGSRQLSITEFSIPNSVESGEDARLNCKYELTSDESDKALFVKWWWTPLNSASDERNQLYQRIAGHPAVALHNDIKIEENDSILLLNVTPEDSGTYECEVSNIDEVRKHAELLVFTMGSGPDLNITLVDDGPDADDEDDVLVTCEATDVAPYPDLVIIANGEILPTNESISSNGSTFNINAWTVLPKDKADGVDISCELYYRDVNVTHSPYVDTQTFYIDQAALTTTEDAEDAFTTEATSDPLQYTSKAEHGSALSLLLVIAAFTFVFCL